MNAAEVKMRLERKIRTARVLAKAGVPLARIARRLNLSRRTLYNHGVRSKNGSTHVDN